MKSEGEREDGGVSSLRGRRDALFFFVLCTNFAHRIGAWAQVAIRVRDGKKMQHDGIKVEFGINVKLRYFVRVSISRRMADVVKERDIWVHSFRLPADTNATIKMEIPPQRRHCGQDLLLLVRIKIKHMELSIIRRETTGAPPNQYNESETITKFEIMDGAPVRGETIPIRLFLGGFDLTPTFRDVNKKFSTRYYLNLVLIDEENRRYFKQQEITIVRIPEN
ncbi:vacuolar protein sorting-associated protein 26 [Mycena vitilis]|nr:vacuolar protein sorting-associated protein 26 [Mycena vitilis]